MNEQNHENSNPETAKIDIFVSHPELSPDSVATQASFIILFVLNFPSPKQQQIAEKVMTGA